MIDALITTIGLAVTCFMISVFWYLGKLFVDCAFGNKKGEY